ncbi:MAG TPA: STM3941 family protein [Ktedonobacterales bacterium]|nr:STM3941 family protein [Ktedonobacterales bacterium]
MATHVRRQIVVYPSRVRLLRYALLYLIGLLGMGLFCYWSVTGEFPQSNNPRYDWVFALIAIFGVFGRLVVGAFSLALALLLAVILVCTIYRLLVRKPSVIVDSDGITDGCSLIAGGLGLIRWDEIQVIMVDVRTVNNRRAKYLCVMPRDAASFLRLRQNNPIVRLFRRSITLSLPRGINLPEWLFSGSVDDLVAEIRRRYQQALHAHKVSIL